MSGRHMVIGLDNTAVPQGPVMVFGDVTALHLAHLAVRGCIVTGLEHAKFHALHEQNGSMLGPAKRRFAY